MVAILDLMPFFGVGVCDVIDPKMEFMLRTTMSSCFLLLFCLNCNCNSATLSLSGGINRLAVKAATLIFISGSGSAISSVKEGKLGKELISFLGRANVRAFHESLDRIYTDFTCVNP